MNPYQPGEDNQDPYEVGYKAGAASRDAEVVSLTNQRDYEYVRAENAEQERAQFEQESDQHRAQINVLRHILGQVKEGCLFADDDGGIGVSSECQVDSVLFDEINKALSATPEQSLAASELRKERDALQADNAELVAALEAVIPEVAGGNAGLIAYNKCKAALAKVRNL